MAVSRIAGTAADTGGPNGRLLAAGPLTVGISDGGLRIAWSGTEVLRGIDCPVRDADWRTVAVRETGSESGTTPDGLRHVRRFVTADGSVAGVLRVEAVVDSAGAELTARLDLAPARPVEVNRAGFVLLHPAGLAGSPLEVLHPDGGREFTVFPERISPSQPARDIAGLRHEAPGVAVEITLEGEVFEMEDQRNWTDASYKTYCRPLARPRPYRLDPGETVRQSIRLKLRATEPVEAAVTPTITATMPRITLAHDPALSDGTVPAMVEDLPVDGLLVRVDGRSSALPPLPVVAPITLEIVADGASGIEAVAAACHAAGLAPRRVVALPRGYLASHQPEGPWPEGATPMDLVPMLRAAFLKAAVGGGMLTNFTEFNR